MNFNNPSLSYEAFREQFETITDPRDAALIATVYCGYARVGEIVRRRYDKKNAISILKVHFSFSPTHLHLDILTEKTKQWRKVPTSRKLEDWLHEPIRNYLNYVQGDEVFPVSTVTAEKRFEKHFGTQHIHLLRHWACTHCLQRKRTVLPLSMNEVARLGGWLNFNTFYRTYSHLTTKDFEDKI